MVPIAEACVVDRFSVLAAVSLADTELAIVISRPSRIQAVPSPSTSRVWNGDHLSRSSRAGMVLRTGCCCCCLAATVVMADFLFSPAGGPAQHGAPAGIGVRTPGLRQRHDSLRAARELREGLLGNVQVRGDELGRQVAEPVGQRDLFVVVAAERLDEDQVIVAGVLDVVAEIAPDYADVAGLEVGGV